MTVTALRVAAPLSLLAGCVSLALCQARASAEGIIQRDWEQVIAAGSATRDAGDLSRWTVAPTPEGKGSIVEPGDVIYAGLDHDVPEFTYDPRLRGWYRVLVGLYLPPRITYTGVAARLDNQRTYRCVADPRASLDDRGAGFASALQGDFVEAAFTEADLTGRKIVIHHPAGCRSYVTHFRFVPMTDAEVAAAKAKASEPEPNVQLWLDILDFAHLPERPENDWWQNDARTMHRLVRYFCDYGCTGMGYRFMGGGRARYNSKVLRGERERFIDKRIGHDLRDPWAKYRYGDIDIDLLDEWVKWSHFYGKKAYAVWCYEEGHGYPSFLASYNVEHPQFLSRFRDGTFNLSWTGLSYPEVMDYKLAIAKEVIDRGVDGFIFDFERIWGWYQARDMTYHHRGLGGFNKGFDPLAIAAYQAKYGVDPRDEPEDSRRWMRFSAQYTTDLIRGIRRLCDQSGRKMDITIAVPAVAKDSFESIRACGCDWKTLGREGVVTHIAPIIPPEGVHGQKQTIDDVVAIMESVREQTKGNCRLIWPLTYYKRTAAGIAQNSGLSVPDYTTRILTLMREHGDAGVNLTTVDYNMAGSPAYLDIDVVMRLYEWTHCEP
jgi:hypothetical protein